MAHRSTTLVTLLVLLVSTPAWADEKPDPAAVEFFETKVRPVLVERCVACHGPEEQKSELRLDSPAAMRAGGLTGPAVVSGEPENSPLVEAIRYDGLTKMPPKGKLADDEIEALTRWVKMGAPWPEPIGTESAPATSASASASPTISEEARRFWAFQPVIDPEPPAIRDESWPWTPVDRFVLAKLEEAGLPPSPPADRRTLIRRASFDLTGLPPTPEEVEAFVFDPDPDAFANVVERLLASPHYGERWARHWLDLARYGEDQAHSFKPRLYPNGYRYRDWVVQALNDDLPYDRFVTEQIAADLIDRDDEARRANLPALGFFACGPVYYGDAKGFDQIDDRLDTLGRGLLGLTVACARCHDHKYDPIPTADYYALAGVVASSEYVEAPLVPAEVVEAYEACQARIKAKEGEIEDVLKSESDRIVRDRARESARYILAVWTLRNRPGLKAEEVAAEHGLDPRPLGRWSDLLADREHARALLADWFALLDRREAGPERLDDEGDARESEAVAAVIQGRILRLIDGGDRDDATKALLADLSGEKGLLAVPKDRVESMASAEARERLTSLRAELEQRKADAPPMYPVAHALKEGKPRDQAILLRGSPDNTGPVVPRRFLTVLGGKPLVEGSGRLELARAIASADNPLTARVIVNRVWQHHFGRGLVGTPSNFGQLGERPTHPELLDWLASRFVESGWSLKELHRTILMSATYQQSAGADSQAEVLDPENRLLGRMSRRRLEVEAWRDAMLAVSGRLDPTLGGPSVSLDDPTNRRRTLYAAISRHDLHPLLRLFDFPDPNITSGERTRTTVPLQQLYVLNDEFLIETARALVSRLDSEAGEDDAARIDRAYSLLFGRPPTESERRSGLAFLRSPDPDDAGEMSRWERYAQVLIGTNEFAFSE